MRLPLKSPLVAAWLFVAALMIIVMVCVGGITRLTQSGLSITEWKPIAGAMPPANDAAWSAEFDNYKKIPQFKEINPHMQLAQFKEIYWWEWAHRNLGRLLGAVYLIGFAVFLLMSEVPARLIWRGAALVVLCGCQGLVGWLMVASGLTARISVAPEMLASHLAMALLLLVGTIWTGAEALEGQARGRGAPGDWRLATAVLLGLVIVQSLLGALVAGNQAGLVYNDWPLMNGHFFPYVEWAKGIGYSFLHDQGLVQFVHRMNAYLLLIYATAYAVILSRKANDDTIKTLATVLSTAVWVQATMGIATLVTGVSFGFAIVHQLLAVCLVSLAVVLMWCVARAERVFR